MPEALPDALVVPHPDRLGVSTPRRDEILACHAAACAAGADGYIDPVSGRWVFSATYLWRRGTCCDSGCRHCPYLARPDSAD